ncbi:MAG: tRNA pseudouridine(55) synthase TruB [Clostridia bacterium]|nr:tRNA pseudouridine(55) synthase TruB [Clostridia bacterium]
MGGLILIDKPAGITSFVAVAVVRRALGVKHCGHTGTLDPMAEGLLPILTGKATKLSAYMLEGDKSYTAVLRFGVHTDSYDTTGKVLSVGGRIPTEQEIRDILPRFVGRQLQTPPMFSALKRDGVALYKLAREGKSVELAPREIEIYRLEMTDFSDGEATLEIDCSKGTYIRSLCKDIGEALGTYGCMASLRRTATCGFSIGDALPLETAETQLKAGDFSALMPPEKALPLESYAPPAFFARLLRNGCAVHVKKLKGCPETESWVYDEGSLLGIGKTLQDGTFKIITHL